MNTYLIKKGIVFEILMLLMLFTVVACEQTSVRKPSPASEQTSTDSAQTTVEVRQAAANEVPAGVRPSETVIPPGEDAASKPLILKGTGSFVDSKRLKQNVARATVAETDSGDIVLNFVGAELTEVVHATLGELLGLNYSIAAGVGGTVTLQTSRPLTRSAVLPVVEEVLRLNGVVIVETNGLYKVLPAANSATGGLAISTDTIARTGVSIRIIPLKFVAASQITEVLQPFAPVGGGLRVDQSRNMLFAWGTPQELDGLVNMASVLDVNWLTGMSFGLFPLKAASVNDIVKELESIFDESAAGQLTGILRFLSIDRLNAVLVISQQPEYLDAAQDWIERLDKGDEADQRVQVYRIQNRRAADLANILGQIFSSDTSSTKLLQTDLLAPGLTQATVTTEGEAAPSVAGAIKPPQPTSSRTGSISIDSPKQNINLSGAQDIRIIADESNNALVILATAAGHKAVEAALRQLDILPLQVLIEATIVEVELNDELSYGVRWFFEKGNSSFTFTDNVLGSVSSAFPGFSYFFNTSNVQVALNALQTATNIEVISSPSLMVLDNQTAKLQVGDEVPVATQSSVSTSDASAPIVNAVEFRDTGVILSITPRVNAGGLVILEVEQEVSDVVTTTTSGIDSPTIRQRKIESTVAVQSSETIALGGLVRDRNEEGYSGIPVLSDIPLLGNLFNATDNKAFRSELLVLIKPTVVQSQNEVRSVTNDLRRKLKGLEPLREKMSF